MKIEHQEFLSQQFGREVLMLMEGFAPSYLVEGSNEQLMALSDQGGASSESGQGVAIIPIRGVITNRPIVNWEGKPVGTSSMLLKDLAERLSESTSIQHVLFDVNSPGGQVTGCFEAAEAIRELGKKKNTIACINGLGASAGYMLSAACNRVVATKNSELGSIGTIIIGMHIGKAYEQMGVDIQIIRHPSRKAETNPYEPLSEEALAKLQDEAKAIYEQFSSSVSQWRGIPMNGFEAATRNGSTFMGYEAEAAKLIDGISDLSAELKSLKNETSHHDQSRVRRRKIQLMQFKLRKSLLTKNS